MGGLFDLLRGKMIRIDKSEILKYIAENLINKELLNQINKAIDESIKELKIDILDNKISPNDAQKVIEHIQSSDEFGALISCFANKEKSASKNGNKFWLGFIVAGGLAYGGYDMFLERYEIEQEYAFISICVGEQGSRYQKERCMNKLKQCLKEDKKFKECY